MLDQEGEGVAQEAILLFEQHPLDIGNAGAIWQFILDLLQKGVELLMCGLFPLRLLFVDHLSVYDARIPISIPLSRDAPE